MDWMDTSLLHHLHLLFPLKCLFLFPDMHVYMYVCVVEHILRRCSYGFCQSSRIWGDTAVKPRVNSQKPNILHDGIIPPTLHPASSVPHLLINASSRLLRYSLVLKPFSVCLCWKEVVWVQHYQIQSRKKSVIFKKVSHLQQNHKWDVKVKVSTLFHKDWKWYARQTVAGIKIQVRGQELYTLHQIA